MSDEAALAALIVANDDFGELEAALDVFCPFEAIGMVRQEIRHGHFLAYLFDPKRPHGFDGKGVAALLAAAANGGNQSAISMLDVHLADFDGARVRREWRRIDLLIEVESLRLIIAIELKIEAGESKGQLQRYRRAVEEEWPDYRHLLLFLTVDGDEPEGDNAHWQPLSLGVLVVELQRLLARNLGGNEARNYLAAYLAMLRRHHVGNDRLEELAAALWQKHRAALSFLVDRQPNALSDLMGSLFAMRDDIAKALSTATGLTVVVDSLVGSRTIRFAVADWDNLADMKSSQNWSASNRLLLVELIARRGEVLNAYLVLGRGDVAARERLYQRLLPSKQVANPGRFGPEWKRLASQTLLRLKPDDAGESVAPTAEAIASQFVSFVGPKLKAYDAVLQER